MTDAATAPAEPADPRQRLDLAERLFHQPDTHTDAQILDRVIALLAPAIHCVPHEGLLRARAVLLLTSALIQRFEASSDTAFLDRAETELRDASTLFSPRTDERSRYLATLAWAAYRKAQHTESKQTLDKAVAVANRGYREFPTDPAHREGLARVELLRYDRTAKLNALTRSVHHYERSISLTHTAGVERVVRLTGLANALDRVASNSGSDDDLQRAVQAHRDAVDALAADDPSEATVLCNLGTGLQHLYERTGSLPALIEAIDLHRCALYATKTPKDIQYSVRTEGLANALMYMFEVWQDFETLVEAIELRRNALKHILTDDPMRKSCQANLAASLFRRFERAGDSESLAEAERLLRELVADPDLHGRVKAIRTNALGAVLARRGPNGGGSLADLEEACRYLAEAIDAAETESFEHLPMFRSNLAATLVDRYKHTEDEGLLNEAIGLYRHAIADTPDSHTERGARVANLAHALIIQAEQQEDTTRLDEADAACESVLSTLPPDDAARARCLTITGDAKNCRFELTGKRAAADAALSRYEQAARHASSPVTFRIRAAHAGGVLAAKIDNFEAAFTAFCDAVDLVERVVSPAVSRRDQEQILAALEGMPRAAAAMAIAAGHPEDAVVLLERARNVLLGRAAETRTDYDALRDQHPGLAEELRAIQQELDGASEGSVTPPGETAPSHIPSAADRRARLVLRYEDVLGRIRGCPGLALFHTPVSFSQLQTAASAGPVIIVNVSTYRCDAIVVFADDVQVIELPNVTAQDVAENAELFLMATDEGSAGDLNAVIAWTWDQIAEPVLRSLGLSGQPKDGEKVPRIWWCPTGMAAFLPLHVAGHHEPNNARALRSVLDWTASSYTSTLRALIRLREEPTESEAPPPGVLAVSVAKSLVAPDAPPLTGVERDVDLLTKRFPGITVLADHNATCDNVLREMRSHSWIHFACHGLQILENPSEGNLVLYDDLLTVRRIAQQQLPPGELAFVSACETFRAGNGIPDEGITLAAALQLVGYRHVVATHWKLFGGFTEQVAANFYDTAAVRRHEGPPVTLEGVAEALRTAMLQAREESGYAPPLYWAPYIHIGP